MHAVASLSEQLFVRADEVDRIGDWPQSQLEICRQHEFSSLLVPARWQGVDLDEWDMLQNWVMIAQGCLSTAFILTQPAGAARRIVSSTNPSLQDRVLPRIARGELFASVGISHLTTSRQHIANPAMRASPTSTGYLVSGTIPWVTASPHADYVVTGATLDSGDQLLFLLPTKDRGVEIGTPFKLLALSATCTGPITCHQVRIDHSLCLHDPAPNILALGGAGTGGLVTSALALGHAQRSIRFLEGESRARGELAPIAAEFRVELERILANLKVLATCEESSPEMAAVKASGGGAIALRSSANQIALRASQAALIAAKGAGFIAGHPAGRWCREALFFLVWSCPPAVVNSTLCDLAGIAAD